jgi:hypothetical protein
MFDVLVDELRCRPTEWLAERRACLVREQRRLHVEELAVTRVLDERGAIDDSWAQTDGVMVRDVRETVETARALEALPAIAAVAAEGRLSDGQLAAVVKVAEPGSDREWARRAPRASPADLRQAARLRAKPTAADSQARRAARELGFWWEREAGMLAGRFRLADVDGALFEGVVNHLVDRMTPPKGQPWETRARRGADALVALARNYADVEAVSGPAIGFSVQVPLEGPATIVGIPLPDAMVERLRAEAKIEPVLVDTDATPLATGRSEAVCSPKTLRAVRARDGKCRWPGCDRRAGLQVHHLWPRSWDGPDEKSNLACVCTGGGSDHHTQLAPHGPYLLLGNPNNPDGLHLVRVEDLPALAQLAATRARAQPDAA